MADVFAERTAALLSLQVFPYPALTSGEQGDWLVTGPAFIARATRSLGAIAALREGAFDCDAYTLLRSMYEHVVRFAWLAVDPAARVPLWLKWDRQHRLNAEKSMREVGDTFNVPDGVLALFEREIAAIKGNLPKLDQLASQADEYWLKDEAIQWGPMQRYGFSGLYRVLYKHTSALSHGNAIGLAPVVAPSANFTRVVGPESSGENNPFALATVVYTMGLLVFAEAFFIDGMLDAVRAIFARHPSPLVC